MLIKSMEVKHIQVGNVGWIVDDFKFTTGQKATFHTYTHEIKCFNGIGKDITNTEIGQKMASAIRHYLDER